MGFSGIRRSSWCRGEEDDAGDDAEDAQHAAGPGRVGGFVDGHGRARLLCVPGASVGQETAFQSLRRTADRDFDIVRPAGFRAWFPPSLTNEEGRNRHRGREGSGSASVAGGVPPPRPSPANSAGEGERKRRPVRRARAGPLPPGPLSRTAADRARSGLARVRERGRTQLVPRAGFPRQRGTACRLQSVFKKLPPLDFLREAPPELFPRRDHGADRRIWPA